MVVMRNKMKSILLAITLIIVGVSSLNMIDFPMEFRFEEAKYNYLFVAVLCVLSPLSIFITSFTFKKRSNTYLGIAMSIALAFPCGLIYFFTISDFESISENGIDYSFEKINEINVIDSYYRLYRTNGGATTAFGLVLRKETSLIKGVKTVQVVFRKYKASESKLLLIDNKNIELRIKPYKRGEKTEVITLNI